MEVLSYHNMQIHYSRRDFAQAVHALTNNFLGEFFCYVFQGNKPIFSNCIAKSHRTANQIENSIYMFLRFLFCQYKELKTIKSPKSPINCVL